MEHAAVAAEHIRGEYPRLLDALAETAASTLDGPLERGPGRGTGHELRASFRDALEDERLLGRLPGVLASTVHAVGETLPAAPVAAPPYVAVTSRGVVLRASIDPGRLVVELRVFERVCTGHQALERCRVDAAIHSTTGSAVRTADRT